MPLYIGLMSGTSVDSVDAVLTRIDDGSIEALHRHEHAIAAQLRGDIQHAIAGRFVDAHAIWVLDARLGELFAESALALMSSAGVRADEVRAIGSHGQTLFHAPNDTPPLTVQAGDPNIIAARTGLTTVADFRRRDLALGGQGAPLAPAFHLAAFGGSDERRAIVNIGGIANVTVLPNDVDGSLLGFDSGPGNTLMDQWCQQHCGQPFDRDGVWAASGQVHSALLSALRADPYFQRAAPKSTGREHFNLRWLDERVRGVDHAPPADVQRTLLELTADSIATAISDLDERIDAVYLCGGGALNRTLVHTLHRAVGNIRLETTAALGMHPKDVEGAAFAWLAHRTLSGELGNAPSVTGAREHSVLGAIYPAATPRVRC